MEINNLIKLNKFKIFIIYFSIAMILHLYKFVICILKIKDLFSINKDKSLILNGWTIIHFVLNILIGYFLCKTNSDFIFAFLLGCLWELYEYIYSLNPPILIDIYKYICKEGTKKIILYNPYDIFINLFGLIIGLFLSKYIKKS